MSHCHTKQSKVDARWVLSISDPLTLSHSHTVTLLNSTMSHCHTKKFEVDAKRALSINDTTIEFDTLCDIW